MHNFVSFSSDLPVVVPLQSSPASSPKKRTENTVHSKDIGLEWQHPGKRITSSYTERDRTWSLYHSIQLWNRPCKPTALYSYSLLLHMHDIFVATRGSLLGFGLFGQWTLQVILSTEPRSEVSIPTKNTSSREKSTELCYIETELRSMHRSILLTDHCECKDDSYGF